MSPNHENSSKHGIIRHVIPPTAVEVYVHNISNPYFISVSNVKECGKMCEIINEHLRDILSQTRYLIKYKENEQLKAGTLTIVRGIDLPAWYCRGVIVDYNMKTSKYTTFLPDYGDHVELSRESFITVKPDVINQSFVTYIISMYEILPLKKVKLNKQKKIKIRVDKNWTVQTNDLTMQLVCSSTKAYFHHVTTHKNGIKCGELYLLIDNYIVPLREALIRARCAVYLTDNLLNNEIISESTETSDSLDTNKIINEWYNNDLNNSAIAKARRNIYEEIFISSNIECNPLNNIADAQFDCSVLKALNNIPIVQLRRLQSYIWPAINKGLDVIALGPQRCGKTIGYATPIASIIVNTKQYQVEYHPMALVLCSSSSQVLYIQSIFKELLINYKDFRIIGAYNGCTDRSLLAGIISGCQIFISTPAFLIRFFERDEHHRKQLKFNHISHLIIDDLDVILDKHSTALLQLLGRYTLVGKKNLQRTNMLALQLIAVAQHWSTVIEKFAKMFKNPYICIGSLADAAIFCGIQMRPRLVSQDQKKMKIAELLSNHYRMVKTMIVCANHNEAHELYEYLSENYSVLYADVKMLFTKIIGIRELWNTSVSGMYHVMICTDKVLSTLKISDVTWLIHYSVDLPSKSSFLYRYSTLMSNLKRKSRKVEVTIFIDDTNNLQFRGIMDMVKRSGINISPELLGVIERVSVTLERDKKGYPICNNVKSFGQCRRSGTCHYRHCVLPEIDTAMTPLIVGNRMRFTITYVHSATHFSGRIVNYIDDNNQKHELSDIEHIKITTKIHHYYSDINNRHRSREIIVGGIYAYDDSFDTYQRVQVIDIVDKDKNDAPSYVHLRCIDNGILFYRVRASKVMEMPNELADAPAHVVEIFLANLLPYDDESEWNVSANECTHKWFSDQLNARGAFLQGRVCLHLGNTIWLNSIDVRVKIAGHRELISGSLMSHLIEQKHGIFNREHLMSLKKLCINAGIVDAEELDD